MDRATFERQKAFAGEKKASMKRRCVDNDYTARRMYMVTCKREDGETVGEGAVGCEAGLQPGV